ncbi:MAG: RsmB/NOP family class I SAM-dependent RNA methyltransferase, partial [Acutalibacteraceae bacterium]
IKSSRESRNAGFANAVLRNVLRSQITLPDGKDPQSLSVRYSCPEWIIKSFITDYGADTAEELLKESLKPAPVVIRVNTLKTDTDTLKTELEKRGIPSDTTETENALILKKGIDAADFDLYKKGFFYAEDLSSQTAVSVLNPKKGERVLDMCAAPGGKSFTMALLMENAGEIISCDLYEQRVGLIKSGAERLGIDIIKPMTADASVYKEDLGEFDCILCDVPCSGLGVLRRKPDIKYKPENDFAELEALQYKILENAARYLKKGGRILYSTCTLRRAENEKLVNSFIMEYNGFHKMYEHAYLPHIDKTDGFYCALIVKD